MAYRPDHQVSVHFRRGQGPSVVSDNERRALRILLRSPGVTRSSLTETLELSQQSVHRITGDLESRGMVIVGSAPLSGARGKPSPSLFLQPSFAHAWGVSLGTDEAVLCVMDFRGTPLSKKAIMVEGAGRATVLVAISVAMAEMRAERNLLEDRCLGMGFGITGFWMEGTQYNPPLPLNEWALIELGPLLAAHFRMPVWLQNNANAAALAEAMLGHGRKIRTFGYVSFNYGLGGSIVINGKLETGGRGNAGEVSAIFTADERADRPTLQSLLETLRASGVDVLSIRDLADRFDPHWPGVDRWMGAVVPKFERIVAAFWAIIDPEAVVLGGQIPESLAQLLISRAKFTSLNRYGVSRQKPALLTSELGAAASSIGAAAHVMSECAF